MLKLKELQLALIANQSLADGPEIDTDEARKDLNAEFDAIWTDLRDLKLGVKTFAQRAIVDVFVWDLSSKLYSAIRRIRLRTLQVGTALSLESESDLDVAF